MFQSKVLIMQKLLNTNAHLGYQTATSNFQPYLYGFRNQIAIIDLDNTLRCLRRACSLIQIIIRSKGHLLLVNNNPEYNNIVRQTAEQTGQSFINHKWIGGLLTNWNHTKNVHAHFKLFYNDHFEKANRVPTYPMGNRQQKGTNEVEVSSTNCWFASKSPLTSFRSFFRRVSADKSRFEQKASSVKSRSIMNTFPRFQKMQKCFEGIVTQDRPDCIILFNANQNRNAIEEANRLRIPIICLVDSNVPNKLQNRITYPIPANADSLQFVYILCNSIFKTIMYSQKKNKSVSLAKEAQVSYR